MLPRHYCQTQVPFLELAHFSNAELTPWRPGLPSDGEHLGTQDMLRPIKIILCGIFLRFLLGSDTNY